MRREGSRLGGSQKPGKLDELSRTAGDDAAWESRGRHYQKIGASHSAAPRGIAAYPVAMMSFLDVSSAELWRRELDMASSQNHALSCPMVHHAYQYRWSILRTCTYTYLKL